MINKNEPTTIANHKAHTKYTKKRKLENKAIKIKQCKEVGLP